MVPHSHFSIRGKTLLMSKDTGDKVGKNFVTQFVYILLKSKSSSSPDPAFSKVRPPGFGTRLQLPPAALPSTAEPDSLSAPQSWTPTARNRDDVPCLWKIGISCIVNQAFPVVL